MNHDYMSLYNMVNGFNLACLAFMPMLGRKQEDYPRFRDCFVANKEEIGILTRVGGNNRNQGYGEEELYKDPHFRRTFDDDFDSTYGYYIFGVPEKWKKDFDAIMNDRFSDVSEEYIKYLEEFWPNISTSGIFRKVFRGEEPESDVKPAPTEQDWIPVNEEMPPLRHDVWLTVFFHESWMVVEGYRQDGEFMFWYHGRLESALDEENRVTAWKPKSKPYQPDVK